MNESNQTSAQQLIGDFAPKLVDLADNVLFGDVRERPELRGFCRFVGDGRLGQSLFPLSSPLPGTVAHP